MKAADGAMVVEDFRWLGAAAPAEMDALWAAGWRHFGERFFRFSAAQSRGRPAEVRPLRIDCAAFAPSASQRRALKRNADLEVDFAPARIDAERDGLFFRHRARFVENIPDRLGDFLSAAPARVPCMALECAARRGGRLLAVGYLDVGAESASAVFAMFEPSESRRSLGIFLILRELAWCRAQGKRWMYLGYSYDIPSPYDYKKQFSATERYDWAARAWLPAPRERP